MNREVIHLFDALKLIRQRVSKDMPTQQILLLLTVARHPGITMPELMQTLDMPQGTVSRNVKALAHSVSWQNGIAVPRGYGLLRTLPSVENRQVLAVFLTERGKTLIEELARRIGADYNEGGGAATTAQRRLTGSSFPLAH